MLLTVYSLKSWSYFPNARPLPVDFMPLSLLMPSITPTAGTQHSDPAKPQCDDCVSVFGGDLKRKRRSHPTDQSDDRPFPLWQLIRQNACTMQPGHISSHNKASRNTSKSKKTKTMGSTCLNFCPVKYLTQSEAEMSRLVLPKAYCHPELFRWNISIQ